MLQTQPQLQKKCLMLHSDTAVETALIRHAMSKTEKYAKYYFVMSFFSDVCPDAIDDIAG